MRSCNRCRPSTAAAAAAAATACLAVSCSKHHPTPHTHTHTHNCQSQFLPLVAISKAIINHSDWITKSTRPQHQLHSTQSVTFQHSTAQQHCCEAVVQHPVRTNHRPTNFCPSSTNICILTWHTQPLQGQPASD